MELLFILITFTGLFIATVAFTQTIIDKVKSYL